MSSSTRRPPSVSPSRPNESQLEILYNTAVQSFVRRDHANTQATLSRLLKLLKARRAPSTTPWYDLETSVKEDEVEGWLIKTLKLVISSHASLYTDPPSTKTLLPSDLRSLLPPASPDALLRHVQTVCTDAYFPPSSPEHRLLPPPLLSTLLLASLKLSLPFAHHLAEDWLALLPDSFVLAISPDASGVYKQKGVEEKKRVEAAREGYLKITELFVGEVLAREGEWEMARGFLEGEVVMGSKRKENLYRHLRALQTKPRSATSSPANSGILPSSTVISPSPSPKPNGRSRSNSSSSSSSERTARPNTINGLSGPQTNGHNGTDRKGKARSNGFEVEDEKSESSVPSKIFVDHPSRSSRSKDPAAPSRINGVLQSALASLSLQLQAWSKSDWIASTWSIPIPIIVLVVTFLSVRRRLARRNGTVIGTAPAAVAGGTATLAANAIGDVRERLRRARGRGVLQWVAWWLRWWIARFAGVWRLGTTVTYV